jgi:hypothetical protein
MLIMPYDTAIFSPGVGVRFAMVVTPFPLSPLKYEV